MKKNKMIKENISLFLIVSLVVVSSYMFFEPQLVEAVGDDIGVTQTVSEEINIDCDATAALSPAISGQSGGSSSVNFTCTVETNNATGYTLKLEKNQTLQTSGGGTNKEFSDYTTTPSPLTYAWVVPGSDLEEWGFNIRATSADAEAKYEDNGADTCGSGSSSDDHCWDKIPTTPAVQIASSNTATAVGGTATIIGLKAQADGATNNLQSGAYACTITATALVQ